MAQKHDADNGSSDGRPEYLNEVLDEAEECQRLEPGWSAGQVADSVAFDQMNLIASRHGEPTNLEVLQDLRDLDMLSARDLDMNRTAAPSYNPAEATIQALVISSLSKFIREYLIASGE